MQLPAEQRRICAACLERESYAMACVDGAIRPGSLKPIWALPPMPMQQQIQTSQRGEFALESRAFRVVIGGCRRSENARDRPEG